MERNPGQVLTGSRVFDGLRPDQGLHAFARSLADDMLQDLLVLVRRNAIKRNSPAVELHDEVCIIVAQRKRDDDAQFGIFWRLTYAVEQIEDAGLDRKDPQLGIDGCDFRGQRLPGNEGIAAKAKGFLYPLARFCRTSIQNQDLVRVDLLRRLKHGLHLVIPGCRRSDDGNF